MYAEEETPNKAASSTARPRPYGVPTVPYLLQQRTVTKGRWMDSVRAELTVLPAR